MFATLLVLSGAPAQADPDFVILGEEGAWLKQNSTVVSGDVGVNKLSQGPFLANGVELTVGLASVIQSPTVQVLADSIKLKDNAQVYDIHYNDLSGLGDILGQQFTPLALPLVPALPPVPPFTPGTQDFDVPQSGSLSLGPGSYGLLKARLGSTVTLTGGTYDFSEWDVGQNVTVEIETPTEIRIAGRLMVDQGSTVLPAASAPTLTANDIVFFITGINGNTGNLGATPKAAKFGISTTVRAKVFVPNGTLWLRQNSVSTGAFVGKWVILGLGASATFEGGFNLRGVQVGALTQARAGHAATLLGDGRVLLTGGTGATGVLDSAETFDPTTLTASALTNLMTSPRTDHTATLLPQSETLLVAGDDGFGLLNTTEMFTAGSDAFRTLTPTVQILRSGHTATALLDGRVLITGGQSSGALAGAEVFDAQSAVLFLPPYDPETATFEILQHGLTTPRWDHTATLLPDGRILITGGRNGTGVLNTAEIFDPATEEFTALTGTLTTARAAHTATLLPNGTVVLLGGEDTTGVLATAERFDPATETFASVSTGLDTARKNHTATLLPFGEVLIAGGHDGTAILATTELYSPAAGDTSAPMVSQVLPPDAATGVEPNQIVGVRFSEPLNVTTLTATNVTLTNGGTVAAVVSPAEEGLMAFVVPNAPLTSGTTYTLSLSSAITDTAGNPLPPFTSTFTTAAEPVITDFTPQQGPEGTEVTITGQNFDPVASRNEVKFNGVVASVSSATDTTIVTTVPTGATTGPITVTTADGTATSATDFTVATGPAITDVTPLNGPFGTAVTITGSGFDPVPSNNQVAFNGTAAIITSATTTTITTTVPLDATSGFITVTTPQDTATSPQPFDVTFEQDFTLAALPAQVTVPSAGQAAFALTLAGTGGFANLVTLQVTGVPAGTSAAFSAPTLTTGQSAFLTLSTNGTTATGTYPLTVTGTGLLGNVQTVRSVPVNLQVLGAGVTTFSGQVLDEEAKPVKGALVTLGSLQVSTDDGGNFLMQNPPVGADQQLFIDGGPASTPEHSLPIIPYKVTIVAGQANTLGFTPYLHFQKTTGLVDISNSSVERIVTDPDIPGFEMRIPAGVTITGWDGQPNTQISIRRVPIDRTPLPPIPAELYVQTLYMDYFGKPGGGTPSAPIPITFPNDLDVPPGTQVQLWYFDEAPDGSRPNQWAQYGTGTVTADGSQVVPDIDPSTGQPFGQPRFCCGAVYLAMLGNAAAPPGPKGPKGGDPVDLATGLFTLEKPDLVLPDRLPITFTRTYHTNSAVPGPFGPGTSHSFNIRVVVQANLWTLVLSDGSSALFPKQPDGITYRNTNDPSMQGAVFTDTFNGPSLRFKDGRTWTFEAPVPGALFLTSQSDRNGNTITLTRSGPEQTLTTITGPSGRQLNLTYDGNNRITVIQDPLGRTMRYSYDALGRLSTVMDPEGGVTRYTYDAAGRMLTLTDPRGITFLTNEYDSGGHVSRQTQADQGVWEFAYTTTGTIITQTAVTDPRGQTTTYRFNGRGYLLSQADALGQTTTFTLDARNQPTVNADPLGRTTSMTYDAAGNVTTITDADGNVTQFEYEPTFNRVTKITDALNQETTFTYDANGNLTATTNPLNETTTIAYNGFGQPTSVTDPLNHTTTFAYDADGNLSSTTDPLGNTTSRIYDTASRLISITDPRGSRTQFHYDALDRVTAIADPRQGLTRFAYDPNGNLLSVADAKGQTTTYAYDEMDRLETRTDALNRQETYVYDRMGNLTQFTDRKQQVSTFTYDALNRRIQADYEDGSSTTFAYDSMGRLAVAEDSTSGRIEFTYDSLDRLTKEITPQGVVEYTYDTLGRRTMMQANGLAPIIYQYDADSRLTQVTRSALVAGFDYDAAGRRTSLSYPNGTNTTYTYDAASRLIRILLQGPTGVLDDLVYTYDETGNRTSVNRISDPAVRMPTAIQAQYDEANRLTQLEGNPLAYDHNGNLLTNGPTTYQWDARNRLIGISTPTISSTFEYDGLGRRILSVTNGVPTSYMHDGSDIILEMRDGLVQTAYVRNLAIDEPLYSLATDQEFYNIDAIGTVLSLTDFSGVTSAKYSYEPFGEPTVTGTTQNTFQFTGRERDATGLYFYRTRYYSPALRRFLSEDIIIRPNTLPVVFCQGRIISRSIWPVPGLINNGFTPLTSPGKIVAPYVYTDNNPINFSDPMGMDKNGNKCNEGQLAKCRLTIRSTLTAAGCGIFGRVCFGMIISGAGAAAAVPTCSFAAGYCVGIYVFTEVYCLMEANCIGG